MGGTPVAYFNEVLTLVYMFLTSEPMTATVPTMAIETPEAINAYSIAVAPASSSTKRRKDLKIADATGLNITLPLAHNKLVRCGIRGSSAGGMG
jgi:hypothetical protein